MGVCQEKYTREYYMGVDKDGNKLNYGATRMLDDKGRLILRKHDQKILDKIDFQEKNVLCIGCGRGEEIIYAVQHGAVKCTGVDFSQSAIDIADEVIKTFGIPDEKIELVQQDALIYVKELAQEIIAGTYLPFDIVLMLDFIEHVPRGETTELLNVLADVLKREGIIVINTPFYKYDNDVIVYGYDERNNVNFMDTSDINPATCGMHCNKYTCISLQKHLYDCGFVPVTEAHYFVKQIAVDNKFEKVS